MNTIDFGSIRNLGDLCDAINNADDLTGVDMKSLPTFGGNDPADVAGVWSWDTTHLLVSDGPLLKIVERSTSI